MQLGTFSVSLAVKDLHTSLHFYQNLGFSVCGGDGKQNWLMLKNGDCVIGLFQGMFEKNILTFNPGWDGDAKELDSFTDIRDLQKRLRQCGVEFSTEADESADGPANFTIIDPDGNAILVDQHV